MTFVRSHPLQLGLAVAGVALLGLSAIGCSGTAAPAIPAAEAAADPNVDRNKDLVNRYLQAEHRGDIAAMSELMSDDFKQYGLGVNSVSTEAETLESIREHWEVFLALTAVLLALGYWRTRPGFLRHAYVTNAALMTAGFVLAGYQLTGYFAGSP